MKGRKAMPSNQNSTDRFEQLRLKAEKLIQQKPTTISEPTPDILDLIHELAIHQAELEIQNEELQRAHHEISSLEKEYEDLYEFAPCGYLTLNDKGIITRANLTAVKLLDKPRSHILKTGLTQYIDTDWVDAYLANRARSIETQQKESIDLPLKTKNGEPVWVRVKSEAELDEKGEVVQWRILLVDITAQHKAEKELRHSQKMESIGTLAGGVAHEFNNLLYIIMGNNEFVIEEFPEWSPIREGLEEIRNASLRARDIVKQLLTFGRKDDSKKKAIDTQAVVKESMKLICSTLPANIQVNQTISDDVDPILGNETQINQILINLCSNAQYALMDIPEGVISIHLSNVEISQTSEKRYPHLSPGRYIKLTVGDNGCGIKKQDLEKVFDPYFTTKDINKGTGIGLAVVYGIVKDHNGYIFVNSEISKGTVFSIYLPVYQGRLAKDFKENSYQLTGEETILFVDDEPQIFKLGKRRLELLGYDVKGSTDPIEALEMFKAEPDLYDLVITDMAMPHMTGDQFVSEILKIRPQVPTILCTGYSQKISEEKACEIGICSFAMKPIEADKFASIVRKTLDESKKS